MSLKKLLESLDQIGQASPTSAPTNSVDQLHQQLAEQWSEFDDDDEASDDQDFYVAIANDDGSAFVGRLTQRDGRWREEAVAGLVPDGWGEGRYMSYLRANDLMSWLQRDYSEVRGPFDSADQAASWAEQNYGDINESAKVNTATLNDDDWYVVNTKTGEILSRRGPQGGTLAQQQAAEAGGDVQALKGLHIKTRHRNLLNMQEARGQMNYEPKVSEWAVIPDSKKQFVSRFSTRQQAEAHAQQHGGRVTALDQMGRIIKMREARPDFLDLDGDGDTSEPMKKAAADKKRAEQTGQSVLNELTQGQSYTQKQLMDKIRSGDWEATYDIKPGRHVEMRHHSGRRVTVHVKNQTKLGEYTVNEISWADSLGELNMSAQEIIEKSQSDGTISQRQVMKFRQGQYFLVLFRGLMVGLTHWFCSTETDSGLLKTLHRKKVLCLH
jgi:hypothetical protein